MKKILIIFVSLLVLIVGGIFGKFQIDSTKTYSTFEFSIESEVENADVALGERIYHVRAGCIDCHGKDLTGAMVMDNGAMGTIHGANITPYNLKDWSDTEIARAIRYGVHKTGRSLRFMPAFDYEGYSKEDIAAVIKYLRSVPAVEKPSHQNSFGPIAKVMSSLGKMPVMFPAKVMDLTKGFALKPEELATIEFGKYMANSCVGCHGNDYKGGPIPGGDPSWPAAANIRLGDNKVWTRESFTQMIKTGISPTSGQELKPPMPIWLLKEYDEKEIEALWLYLSSLKN